MVQEEEFKTLLITEQAVRSGQIEKAMKATEERERVINTMHVTPYPHVCTCCWHINLYVCACKYIHTYRTYMRAI